MENGKMESLIMELIMNSGNAKSLAMEAIQCAYSGATEDADEKINEANQAVVAAHKIQTQLLSMEAGGEGFHFSLLLTHSQDHLMTTISTIDMAKEIIRLWKKVIELGGGK